MALLFFAAAALAQTIGTEPALSLREVEHLELLLRDGYPHIPLDSRLGWVISLLQHYCRSQPQHPRCAAHIVTWIETYPELAQGSYLLAESVRNPAGHEAVRQAWARAVAAAPDNLRILRKAAEFLQVDHPDDAERLLASAVRWLPDASLARALGFHYALNILGLQHPSGEPRRDTIDARRLRVSAERELEACRHPLVLASASAALMNWPSGSGADEPGVLELSARLMGRAKELEAVESPLPAPDEFFGGVEAALRPVGLVQPGHPGGVIGRIKGVAPPQVIEQKERIYPEAALRAGIASAVRFAVELGKDGRVRFSLFLSGPPELVPAALQALRGSRYDTAEGTYFEVTVPFQLPAPARR